MRSGKYITNLITFKKESIVIEVVTSFFKLLLWRQEVTAKDREEREEKGNVWEDK